MELNTLVFILMVIIIAALCYMVVVLDKQVNRLCEELKNVRDEKNERIEQMERSHQEEMKRRFREMDDNLAHLRNTILEMGRKR